jgi:enamine deaminase RidA (YjgF/YER057c/UK114 family)
MAIDIHHETLLNAVIAGGVATKDLVFVSGTTPSINGTIPKGIEAQTASHKYFAIYS